jgi:hypothetical protein
MSEADHDDHEGVDLSNHNAEFLRSLLPDGGRSNANAFKFVRVGELEIHAPEFRVEGLVEMDCLGLIFGDPASGKTFVSADLGLCVATGTPFHGRQVKQGNVFYIAGEGHNGLARRFAAWAAARGVSIKDAPFYKSTRGAQFLDADSAETVTREVQALADENGDPALIIIDTLARNFGPGDENSTKDMGAFVAAVDDLRACFPGCVVLIVHHSGHADKGRARGAMALKGALDFEFQAKKEGDVVTLENTKMKDAEPPRPMTFELRNVDLGNGAGSAALHLIDNVPVTEKAKQPSKLETLARRTFIDAATSHAIDGEGGAILVSLEDWRAAFYARHPGDNQGTKRREFNRARTELAASGKVIVDSDLYQWNEPSIGMLISAQRKSGTSGTKRDNLPESPGAEAA